MRGFDLGKPEDLEVESFDAPKCNAPEESSDTRGEIKAPNHDTLEENPDTPKYHAPLVRSRMERLQPRQVGGAQGGVGGARHEQL